MPRLTFAGWNSALTTRPVCALIPFKVQKPDSNPCSRSTHINDLESGWQYEERECRNTGIPMGRSNRNTFNTEANENSRKQKVVCGMWTTSRGKREKYAYRAKIKREREQAREKPTAVRKR